MTSHLFWKGFLVLALGRPAQFKANGGVLWISSKDYVKAQSSPGNVTLLPLKVGALFVSGFQIPGTEPNPLLITTEDNFLAIERCKSTQGIDVSQGEILFKGDNILEVPKDCGFDHLRLTDLSALKNTHTFINAEKNLRRTGISTGLADWKKGRRSLTVYSSLSEKEIKKRMPPDLQAFYEIDLRAQVSPGKNIIFELTLFEFSKERAQNLGLKWPKSISLLSIDHMGNPLGKLQDTTTGGASEILLQGDFGESQGVGRVLAQPTLRTQPGVESKFLSGGEFPVRSNNAFHSETTWKSYGLKIALTPNAQSKVGDREVSVDFKLEFSEPNMDHAVEGIPSLTQRQLESHFDVRMNELTVLTTMVTLREGQGHNGVAFLSQIPILSYLFAQHSKLNNNSELCFALKPTWDEMIISKSNMDFNLKTKESL